MTTIKLRTSDQHLIVTNRVKLAKGDINSVDLRVYLDSAWDEFPNVSAIASNDAVNFPGMDFLLAPNFGGSYHEGGIPSIYLSKAGTLSISITGVSNDGTKKKTSTIVKMKVYESLVNAETTIEPEIDLYMQYLAALKEEVNPTITYINRIIDEKAAAIEEMIEEQRTWMNGDELWKNPDPSAEIGDDGLTIPIDRTQYSRLHIEVLSNTLDSEDETKAFRQCLCVHSNGKYTAAYVTGTGSRTITVTDTNIHIGKSSHSKSDTIPFRIIGYKY
jgi:hypothetical protein